MEYEGPGSERFRELLRREREDMAWLVHAVAAMYDEISGGAISNPMTYPSEVIGVYQQRLVDAEAAAAADARAELLAELRAAVEQLDRHMCEPCEPDPRGSMLDRASVLALVDGLVGPNGDEP